MTHEDREALWAETAEWLRTSSSRAGDLRALRRQSCADGLLALARDPQLYHRLLEGLALVLAECEARATAPGGPAVANDRHPLDAALDDTGLLTLWIRAAAEGLPEHYSVDVPVGVLRSILSDLDELELRRERDKEAQP